MNGKGWGGPGVEGQTKAGMHCGEGMNRANDGVLHWGTAHRPLIRPFNFIHRPTPNQFDQLSTINSTLTPANYPPIDLYPH